MTADPDIVRRVRRLENDTDSLYDLIEATTGDIKLTLAKQDTTLKDLAEALNAHSAQLNAQGAQLNAQGAQLTGQGAQLTGHTETLADHTTRLARIGATLSVYDLKLMNIESSLTEILRRLEPRP